MRPARPPRPATTAPHATYHFFPLRDTLTPASQPTRPSGQQRSRAPPAPYAHTLLCRRGSARRPPISPAARRGRELAGGPDRTAARTGRSRNDSLEPETLLQQQGDGRDLARTSRAARSGLRHLARIAAAAAAVKPELAELFKPPAAGLSEQDFRTGLRNTLTRVATHQELLLEHGLRDTLPAELTEMVERYEQVAALADAPARTHRSASGVAGPRLRTGPDGEAARWDDAVPDPGATGVGRSLDQRSKRGVAESGGYDAGRWAGGQRGVTGSAGEEGNGSR